MYAIVPYRIFVFVCGNDFLLMDYVWYCCIHTLKTILNSYADVKRTFMFAFMYVMNKKPASKFIK